MPSTLAVAVLTTAALAGSLATTASATSAEAATTAAPTAAAADTKTSSADIDGDGRRDRVTFAQKREDRRGCHYTLTVKTARGAVVSTPVTARGACDPLMSWWGPIAMDGTPGAEIVVNLTPGSSDFTLRVYRWQRGALVLQAAPGARGSRDARNTWVAANTPRHHAGYTFSTKRGVRYVVRHDLRPYRKTGKLSGTHTTYRWAPATKTWVRVSSTRSGLVTERVAQLKYSGILGAARY